MKTYLGIDPGKAGGIAVIRDDKIIAVTTMLMGGKDLNLSGISNWIWTHAGNGLGIYGCIEKVHAMPGQGVTSMFKFGFVTGAIHGILATLEVPYYLVTPQAWKKEILSGTAKDKAAAVDYCLRAFPNISLLATERSRKPHSGIVDAICIAIYASKHY